jgi:hypothetical protein
MHIVINSANGEHFTATPSKHLGLCITSAYGHICVLTDGPFSPAKHSITDFVVNEGERSKGHGDALVKEALRRFPTDIGGQASSVASVMVLYKNGFRNPAKPDLKDTLALMREYSSVYMRRD